MAQFFKKRKKPSGPNKNEQKVMRGRETRGTPLGARFPGVEGLTVRLEFLGPQKQVLSTEERSFGPEDEIDFTASCPGRCGTGSFNLTAKIEEVLTARLARSQSSGICQERLYAGSEDVCGCELKAVIEAEYSA